MDSQINIYNAISIMKCCTRRIRMSGSLIWVFRGKWRSVDLWEFGNSSHLGTTRKYYSGPSFTRDLIRIFSFYRWPDHLWYLLSRSFYLTTDRWWLTDRGPCYDQQRERVPSLRFQVEGFWFWAINFFIDKWPFSFSIFNRRTYGFCRSFEDRSPFIGMVVNPTPEQ